MVAPGMAAFKASSLSDSLLSLPCYHPFLPADSLKIAISNSRENGSDWLRKSPLPLLDRASFSLWINHSWVRWSSFSNQTSPLRVHGSVRKALGYWSFWDTSDPFEGHHGCFLQTFHFEHNVRVAPIDSTCQKAGWKLFLRCMEGQGRWP